MNYMQELQIRELSYLTEGVNPDTPARNMGKDWLHQKQ